MPNPVVFLNDQERNLLMHKFGGSFVDKMNEDAASSSGGSSASFDNPDSLGAQHERKESLYKSSRSPEMLHSSNQHIKVTPSQSRQQSRASSSFGVGFNEHEKLETQIE